jgi:ribosome-associated protein
MPCWGRGGKQRGEHMIDITEQISLNESEIEEHFIRSPGPGGQNVNKTASAVQLRFDARHSPALSNAVFLRLKTLAGRRMTRDGVIVITANRQRAQEANRRDALDRLVALIREAATPPKHRRPTRPSKAARQRRVDAKTRRGNIKKGRGRVGRDE